MRKWACVLNSIKQKEIILTDIYSKVKPGEKTKEGNYEREYDLVKNPKVICLQLNFQIIFRVKGVEGSF